MQKGILVGCQLKDKDDIFNGKMKECIALCEACNIEIIDTLTQRLNKEDRRFCIGSGKVEELKEKLNDEVDFVIFYNSLTPFQMSNLQEVLEMDVIDRNTLILTIFSERAKTKEAQIQVEMARLQMELPRLVLMEGADDQQQGGSSVRNRGKGESRLELNRRHLKQRLSRLKKELKEVQKHQLTQSKKRKNRGMKTVALVGYTNAGKSSLMNAILKRRNGTLQKQVESKDMLFATLDTSTRRIRSNEKEYLVVDTVGFVSDLPHELIESFKSTLSALKEADLLIHVIDGSHPDYESQIDATKKTIDQVGASHIPVIYVYNKSDLVEETQGGLWISTKTMDGIETLLEQIENKI